MIEAILFLSSAYMLGAVASLRYVRHQSKSGQFNDCIDYLIAGLFWPVGVLMGARFTED